MNNYLNTMLVTLGFLIVAGQTARALVLPGGVGRLPALGWNSWNAYACNINESSFLVAAEAMVSPGFKDAGYEYVNVDDCWSVLGGRDNVTQQIIPDLVKFPEGMSGLAAKIHALGLRFGIYSSAGTETCAGYPASIGYESIDAATFAGWGVDYLKYDNCNVPSNWTDACKDCVYDFSAPAKYLNGTCLDTTGLCPAGYNFSQSNTAHRYGIMRDALQAQNRTILYSLCEWGQAAVADWGASTASSWRMSTDIRARWSSVLGILNMNSFLMKSTNFWAHSDADMLEVGNGPLSFTQSRTHFAFWAAMKSPLIIGTDLTKLSQANIGILQNKYLLSFNQDPVFGTPAMPYKWGTNPDWTFNASFPAEYWAGRSKNGTLVLMLNIGATAKNMTAHFGEIPGLSGRGGRALRVVDAWTDVELGRFEESVEVEVAGYDTAVLLVKD